MTRATAILVGVFLLAATVAKAQDKPIEWRLQTALAATSAFPE